MNLSPRLTLLSALPSIIMLALFYSLAIHMYRHLGSWPASIGNRGFSPSLNRHAEITGAYLYGLLFLNVFVWPIALVVCLLFRRLRRFVVYLVAYALCNLLCVGLVLLAPSPYLTWWKD